MEQKIIDVLTVALKNSAYAGIDLSQNVLNVIDYINALTKRAKDLDAKAKELEGNIKELENKLKDAEAKCEPKLEEDKAIN